MTTAKKKADAIHFLKKREDDSRKLAAEYLKDRDYDAAIKCASSASHNAFARWVLEEEL